MFLKNTDVPLSYLKETLNSFGSELKIIREKQKLVEMSSTNSKVDQHQTTSHAQEIDNHIHSTSDYHHLQPNIEVV